MSLAESLQEVWNQGDSAENSKTHTFVGHLVDHGLLAGRPLSHFGDSSVERQLSQRNEDRIRILKRLTASPSGLPLKTIVSECIKGQRVGQCERFDGSDADYQFAYTFLHELCDRQPPLVRKCDTPGGLVFEPRTPLIDLISQGITETTTQSGAPLYDREFARDILQHSKSLNSNQKEHLESALESYVSRIDDYRLLFDVTTYGDDGHGATTDRMTKPYKTRFNDQGRIARQYSKFQSALEYQFDRAENAVLCTLTSDPGTTSDPTRPDPRPIGDTSDTINPNFHSFVQFLERESKTIRDTRKEGVPQWRPELDSSNYCYLPDGVPKGGPPEGPVSGRPGEKLDYIKVLEFTEKGFPHLHVLFFDVPTRTDGMPWLIDKAELEDRWKSYGQGQIVDTYPLVYRDHLDQLDAEFANDVTEGFVDWYKYGDHDHSDQWVQERIDEHTQIDFGSDRQPTESTAGAYLGKYLSATFGALMDTSESIETPDDTHEDKAATWKLALYWATEKKFWSCSRDIEQATQPNEHSRESSDVAETVRWTSVESVSRLAYGEILNYFARRSWSDTDDLAEAAQQAAEKVVTPNIESTLPESSDFGVIINYIGAFATWDLPTAELSTPRLDDTTDQFEQARQLPSPPQADRPPPIESVWHD